MKFENDISDFLRFSFEENLKMIMVGGGAVNFHGYQRHSADVDFWISIEKNNLEKLVNVLKKMGIGIEKLPKPIFEGKQNISIKISPLQTIELITNFNPNKSFEEAYKSSIETNIEGIPVSRYRVISYDDLITSKIKSGRPKDLLDIQELERRKNKNEG